MSPSSPQPDPEPEFKVPPYVGEDYTTAAICEGIYALWDSQGTHGSLDGDDPLADNIKRAKKASDAIEVYAEASGLYDGEHVLTAIGDLMSDLRHLFDFIGLTDESEAADGNVIDLESLAARDYHYEAEIRGEL